MSVLSFAVPAVIGTGIASVVSLVVTARAIREERRGAAHRRTLRKVEVRVQGDDGRWETVVSRETAGDNASQSYLTDALRELNSTDRIKSA